ncbi:hypothetical protein A4D02_09760 [Niastella koreensis]|uniref:STAS domain-containing protein n=2 Tax=Niastella koreensis TaxID=354356 RepID=G8TNC2_NIAKG|nr:hypothetical protein [Niastella koreensis]AEV98824.1 hypothetical protein Niako_2484 [Niastella koreensis GR20-10]OQP43759.1 hypothetical protein A4D02_09760 [Niastella koreensis]
MDFRKSIIKSHSKIDHEAYYNEDNSVLMVKFSGHYNPDAEGVFDGIYMQSILASHYFAYGAIAIILDLRGLDYTGGRTILRSINFFRVIGRDEFDYKKKVFIIASRENKPAIEETLSILPEPNQEICDYYETAIRLADQFVSNYFSGKI